MSKYKNNPTNFSEAGKIKVTDQEGTQHLITDLYTDKVTVFVFIRHFLCYACRDHIKAIEKSSMEQLEKEYNAKLLVIGCGNVKGITYFASDTQYPSNLIYVDPARNIYKLLNLHVAKGLGDSVDKKGKKMKTGAVSGLCWFFKNRISRGNQGNIYQMGGTFVVNTKGDILYQYRDKFANDPKDVNDLVFSFPNIIKNNK